MTATTQRAVPESNGATASALVRLDSATRRFGSGGAGIVAVRSATATVYPGDRIAVTGRSGSGKSTVLHLMAGLDSPTSGTVTWPHSRQSGRPAPDEVGMVFQGPSLIPALDVVENVRLPLLFIGRAEHDATERAVRALARLNLTGLASALPDELSGGQAQRVAIARTLACAPRLILADEPTGQLDHDTAAGVIDVLLAAAKELGAALVVSTHDPVIARRLPSEWVMRDGRLSTVDIHHTGALP